MNEQQYIKRECSIEKSLTMEQKKLLRDHLRKNDAYLDDIGSNFIAHAASRHARRLLEQSQNSAVLSEHIQNLLPYVIQRPEALAGTISLLLPLLENNIHTQTLMQAIAKKTLQMNEGCTECFGLLSDKDYMNHTIGGNFDLYTQFLPSALAERLKNMLLHNAPLSIIPELSSSEIPIEYAQMLHSEDCIEADIVMRYASAAHAMRYVFAETCSEIEQSIYGHRSFDDTIAIKSIHSDLLGVYRYNNKQEGFFFAVNPVKKPSQEDAQQRLLIIPGGIYNISAHDQYIARQAVKETRYRD